MNNSIEFPTITSLKKGNTEYPPNLVIRLQDKAPDQLHCLGNLSLLKKTGIGFCGSRNVSDKGLQIAKDCATQASNQGYVVVSGNARGVDRAVHQAALESGGETILVLPEGLDHFRIVRSLKTNWDWERVLVISEFPPSHPWKTWNAMKRNKTILSMVGAMIVVEAGEKGGTLAAGMDAFKMGVPLFVVTRTDMEASKGGQILIEMGGRKLGKNPNRDVANMEPIYHATNDNSKIAPVRARQLSFDLVE